MHVIMIGWLRGREHPCEGAGGIEKTVPVMCAELVRQGHQVTFIAPPGSKVEGCEVIETRDMVEAANICNSINADVVHDHTCWSLESPVRQGLRHPHISTTHVNHAIGYTKNVVYLSRSQRTQHGQQTDRNLESSPVIYVPINPDLKPRGLRKMDYLLYLGRIVEEKGVREAAQVAKLLGVNLVVAGRNEGDYAFRIAMDYSHVMFVGEVSDPKRSALIEQAFAMCCLFNDTNGWQEPGCGVFGEAMALNTPVAAFRNGCMPELVRDGLNGWIADNVDDIATFMDHMQYPKNMAIDRHIYSAEDIVKQYVSLYCEVVNGRNWE